MLNFMIKHPENQTKLIKWSDLLHKSISTWFKFWELNSFNYNILVWEE